MIVLPGWFWILTMSVTMFALGLIGVTLAYLKLAELDARHRIRKSD